MLNFDKHVLMLGYGAVAQCALPILAKLVGIPLEHITVMDFEDRRDRLREWTDRGVNWHQARVDRGNMAALLGMHLDPGDLLVDLAWNIDCGEILQWCHNHGVLYLNTSIELWDPYAGADTKHPTEMTLYRRHMHLRRMVSTWKGRGPTAVIEHGANPGLISHWTRKGLLDIAASALADGCVRGADAEEVESLAKSRSFNLLAQRLGVKVIHVSERDTQISSTPRKVDEFVNTWSIEGFREEGITTSEIGWGTHEKELPALAYLHADGPGNQICLARMGINVRVRSWVPNHPIEGMIVRHGEAFTISDRLTVWEGGRAIYRPTVHYAYCPCDDAIASLHELRGRNYELQPMTRILSDEISSGSDILGALIMGHAYGAWWTGSSLSIEESRRLVPHQNATTMQVAISVVAAAMWMIENPDQGLKVPDDLPHDYILAIAEPWLGQNLSRPSDWNPLANRFDPFANYNGSHVHASDPWQFRNFLVQEPS